MSSARRLYAQDKFDENKNMLPEHMQGAMHRYIFDKIEPGSFLEAVLCNDLRGAVAKADHINKARLPEIVTFCMWALPIDSWGSAERYENWLSSEPI